MIYRLSPDVTLYEGDCVDVMRRYIADESIDLTVTSPPYDNLRIYNGFTWDFEATAHELYRVTKPGGVVVWVVADATVNGSETGTSFKQALYFKDVVGFTLHDTMIYAKLNPLPKNHRRYEQQFEYMFVLSKGRPKTFNPLMEPCKTAGKTISTGLKYDSSTHRTRLANKLGPTKTEKIRFNIWYYPVRNHVKGHNATFPEALAADHIVSWSNPGDVIFDPFMGSGTTGKMAVKLGRKFVGIEISRQYIEDIAIPRIQEALYERTTLS